MKVKGQGQICNVNWRYFTVQKSSLGQWILKISTSIRQCRLLVYLFTGLEKSQLKVKRQGNRVRSSIFEFILITQNVLNFRMTFNWNAYFQRYLQIYKWKHIAYVTIHGHTHWQLNFYIVLIMCYIAVALSYTVLAIS